MMRRRKISVGRCLIYIFLIAMTVSALFPLVYAFFGSFKSSVEFLSGGPNILPSKWDVSSYVVAWKEANFARYTLNSILISVLTVVLTLIVGSMASYVLARTVFRGRGLIMSLLGLVMFIPGVVLIFPVFQMCQNLGLLGSIWSMVITQTASGLPFSVILMSSYMSSIPKEIDEAARIEGCGFFRLYWNIALPLSKPILATAGLFAFKSAWNSYLMPLALSLSKPDIRPLTVGVIALKDMGEGITAWNVMIAGSVMALLPMIAIFLFMNRFFIAGVTAGAVKG